ncbi:hypothetical protein I3843_10G124300 [Carya illinoinensis]|nr:hypothetical protein I3843_10G124300 [Carya illinoinensis]
MFSFRRRRVVLRVQNQKLAEEASYAKELASAAAVELKNLAGEVTKLSLQNAKHGKELFAARDWPTLNVLLCINVLLCKL